MAAVIVGCGMVTPVGLSGPETAASARARTARLGEIEWWDSRFQRFVVGRVPEDALPELAPPLARERLTQREERMLRLADVALAHPQLVEHYREACDIAHRSRLGKADTEALRRAMVHYRALFEDLLAGELVGAR